MNYKLIAVNAKYIHSNPAVHSLKHNAREFGPLVDIMEFTINHTRTYVLQEIYKKQPDVLLFSCYIWNISFIEALIDDFSKISPNVPIWLGGPEVSYDAENFLLKHPSVTGVIVGEGEETFYELIKFYEEGNRGADGNAYPKGIVVRDGDKIINKGAREVVDFDGLSFYYEDLEDFENRIIYYESQRGCPFNCSYCLSSVDKTLRLRSLDKVFKELSFFLEKKVPQVKFIDRTFNVNHEHAMAIWKWIYENDNGITNYHFEIGADLLNDEEIDILSKMRPGLIQLECGVQSVNPDTLSEVSRNMDISKLKSNIKRLSENHNIHIHLDLICGLPKEDLASFKNSFNEVYNLKGENLQLGFLKVLKGTNMSHNKDRYGIIFSDHPPYEVLSTAWLSCSDIITLKKVEEMLEIHHNSGQFSTTLEEAIRAFDSPFDFYEKLGDYYENMGYMGIAHSRLKRAEIILEFLIMHDPENEDVYKKTLTKDLYLREPMKKHPGFALDDGPYKKILWKMEKEGLIPKRGHGEVFLEDGEEKIWIFDYDKRDPLSYNAEVREYLLKDLEESHG